MNLRPRAKGAERMPGSGEAYRHPTEDPQSGNMRLERKFPREKGEQRRGGSEPVRRNRRVQSTKGLKIQTNQ